MIINYNLNAVSQLRMFLEPLLDRQAAALKIQQSFRGYIRRRSLRFLIAGQQTTDRNFLYPAMLFQGSLGYADLPALSQRLNEVSFVPELIKNRACIRI